MMETFAWSVVYGTLVFLVWRAVTAVRAYVQMWRALVKMPQAKSHWLLGHMKQVSNSTTFRINGYQCFVLKCVAKNNDVFFTQVTLHLLYRINVQVWHYVYGTKQAIRITYHEGLFQLTNSYEYIMYGTRMARDGHKLHVIWVGPLPIVSVDHPETFKQLIAQTSDKPIGQADPYRIIMPWIGGLKFTQCKNNAILHIRAFYVALIFVIVNCSTKIVLFPPSNTHQAN